MDRLEQLENALEDQENKEVMTTKKRIKTDNPEPLRQMTLNFQASKVKNQSAEKTEKQEPKEAEKSQNKTKTGKENGGVAREKLTVSDVFNLIADNLKLPRQNFKLFVKRLQEEGINDED